MNISVQKIFTLLKKPMPFKFVDNKGKYVPVPSMKKAIAFCINVSRLTWYQPKPIITVVLKSKVRQNISGYNNFLIFRHKRLNLTIEWLTKEE